MTDKVPMHGLKDPTPHFVLVPFMAPGHMIPMVDLAHLLASRGALVTLITTPLNASRIRHTIDRAQESGLPIHFVQLPLPCAEVGLPEGCENVDIVPSPEALFNLFRAAALLGPPLERYLLEHQPAPSCIINDLCNSWTQQVAQNLQLPRFTLASFCCFALLCSHNIWHYKVFERISDQYEPFGVPGIRDRIEVTRAQAPGFFTLPGWEKMGEECREAEFTADGIVVNTFDDLKLSYKEGYGKAMGKKVWSLGPFSLYNKDVAEMALRGYATSMNVDRCLSWLDSAKPGSEVYVSFGSISHVDPSQLIEIGLGLEASGHPFIWVIKSIEQSPEVEQWLSEGFDERMSSKGLIIKGWAPQMMILSHPSIGGFVTHCGWNSCLEGLAAAVPMVTWPHFADQFLNEKLMVDIIKIGVPVGVKVPSTSKWDGKHDGSFVKRDDVEKAIKILMDEGEEGMKRRKRAKELGKKAMEAMAHGGSSNENMTRFIESISEQGRKGKKEVQRKERQQDQDPSSKDPAPRVLL